MENKYYTPELSDIFVGYECEKVVLDFSCFGEGCPKEWEPYVIGHDLQLEDLRNGKHSILVDPRWYRTSYLTKEQILGEGWEDKTHELNIGSWVFEKDKWRATYMFATKLMWVMGLSDDRLIKSDSVFKGKCPSINEFRKICKLLNI